MFFLRQDDVFITKNRSVQKENFVDSGSCNLTEACSKQYRFFVENTFKVFKQSFVVIQNGMLIGPVAIQQTSAGKTIIGAALLNRYTYLREVGLKYVFFSRFFKVKKTLPTAISLVNILSVNSCNYFHWVVDCVMLLQVLGEFKKNENDTIKVIVPNETPEKYLYYLEILGVTKPDIVFWNGGKTKVKKLIIPSTVRSSCLPKFDIDILSKDSVLWLKKKCTESLERIKKDEIIYDKIFISRETENSRKIENINEFRELINFFGFKEVVLHEHNIQKQLLYLKNAKQIIAPHGAGLTNIFMSTDAVVIELLGVDAYHFNFTEYLKLSQQAGNKHVAFFCEVIINRELESDGRHMNTNLDVDLDLLRELMIKLNP